MLKELLDELGNDADESTQKAVSMAFHSALFILCYGLTIDRRTVESFWLEVGINEPLLGSGNKMRSSCFSGCGLTKVALKTSKQPQTNMGTYLLSIGIRKDVDWYGDIVEIKGKRATPAKIMPCYAEDRGKGLIQIDGITRENAETGLDEKAKIQKIGHNTAAKITLTPLTVSNLLQKDKDIKFYINTPGGSVTAGMAIYDTMQYVKSDVSTICVGMAASMGATLLAAGAQGKRFTLPNSEILIHQVMGEFGGQAAEYPVRVAGHRRASGACDLVRRPRWPRR